MCLERLSEWHGEDAPTRALMFAGDIPRPDEPLPRFIDDAAAAKLLRRRARAPRSVPRKGIPDRPAEDFRRAVATTRRPSFMTAPQM
jgi:hypothetical protein